MSSLEDIWDAAALRAAQVPGMKAAYGCGGGVNPAPMPPEDFPDWPICEVVWEGTTITPGNWQTLEHTFSLRVWMNRSDIGSAVRTLGGMLEKFDTTFRADYDLAGTCKQATIVGSSGLAAEDLNHKPFLVIDIGLNVRVERVVTYGQ